ncbi:MAG: SRPBCC family protein [Woeseiaceae bacterium]
MKVTVSEEINAPRERIWSIVTDVDSWVDTISGIVSIEVIDRPESGFMGLKWRETRVLFGKEAVETMWITGVEEFHWYETRAESHGAIYKTRISLDDSNGKIAITMVFSSRPVTIGAKLMSVMGFLFKGTMKKFLQEDLADIRAAAERST